MEQCNIFYISTFFMLYYSGGKVIFLSTITISRQDGSLGNEVAEKLSQRLNIQLVKRDKVMSDWMIEVADSYELRMLAESPKFYLNNFKEDLSYKNYLENRLLEAAEKNPLIVVGMGGQIIFSKDPNAIKVRIIASEETRIQRIMDKYGFDESEARKFLEKSDRKHKRYISTLYGIDWTEPLDYDITLNTDRFTIEQCVEIIAYQVETNNSLNYSRFSMDEKASVEKSEPKEVIFKHPAEEEFANILNMYGLAWEYEPRTFPVQWDAEGNVTMAFSPDFYLTKFDTYIEITTMEQKYVTTKNKKVKRLRELYPGININIVYKKDFHSLLKRFGFSGEAEIEEFNKG